MARKEILRENVTTPIGRLSYPHLFTPQVNDNGDERYKTAIFFEAGTDLKELKDKAMAVAKSAFGDDVAKLIRSGKVRWPFRDDADDVAQRGYPAGSTFVNMAGKNPPGVVDAALNNVTDPGQAYAGRDARINATIYAYDVSGNRGVTFGLNHVQILGHNDRLDGRKDATSVFQVEEGVAIADLAGIASEAEALTGADDDISDLVG